jgi:hypothetical protein
MAHTSNGRGSLLIERRYPEPVGRIRMSSGTKSEQALEDIYLFLDACARSVPPRYDVLLAIRDRHITPLYALSMWRLNRLEEMPHADVSPELSTAVEQWLTRTRASDDHKRGMRSGMRRLLEQAPSSATIAELPQALLSYRESCARENTARMFNIVRSYAEAFVRDVLQPTHRVYAAVQAVRTLPYSLNAVQRRPLLPRELRELMGKLGEPYASDAWQMALTGMGPKEYWGSWQATADRVHIEGTKRESRVRDVPLLYALQPPATTRSAFTQRWRRSKLGCVIYDLRRSYSVWLEEAGISYSRRQSYLGHGAKSVTDRYTQRELGSWLEQDGRRLRLWIERELAHVELTLVEHENTDIYTDSLA